MFREILRSHFWVDFSVKRTWMVFLLVCVVVSSIGQDVLGSNPYSGMDVYCVSDSTLNGSTDLFSSRMQKRWP